MARNTLQTADYDFNVERQSLLLPNGSKSRVFAHVRTDTNEELGYGTEQYGFVQNADLIDLADEFSTSSTNDFLPYIDDINVFGPVSDGCGAGNSLCDRK